MITKQACIYHHCITPSHTVRSRCLYTPSTAAPRRGRPLCSPPDKPAFHKTPSSCNVWCNWPSTPWTPARRRGRPQCIPPAPSQGTLQSLRTLQTYSLPAYTWTWSDLVCLSCPSSLFQVLAHPPLYLLQIQSLHTGGGSFPGRAHDMAELCICNNHKLKNKIIIFRFFS